MNYSLDIFKLSVEAYKIILKDKELLPGRKILHNDIDASFNAIYSCNIRNLGELLNSLATSKKLGLFSEKSGLLIDYLKILKREIGSIETKTVLLKEFPEFDEKTISLLATACLSNSKEYYEFYYLIEDKNEITEKISISVDKAEELYCLCDLVRINGVGAVAAKSFYDAGYKSITDVANANAEEMLEKVTTINELKHYYKAKLGTKDMLFCINYAKLILDINNAIAIRKIKRLL